MNETDLANSVRNNILNVVSDDKNEPCIRQIRLASIMNATTIPQAPKVPFMVPFDPDPDFVPRLDTEGRDIMGQLFSNFRQRRRMGLVGLGGVG